MRDQFSPNIKWENGTLTIQSENSDTPLLSKQGTFLARLTDWLIHCQTVEAEEQRKTKTFKRTNSQGEEIHFVPYPNHVQIRLDGDDEFDMDQNTCNLDRPTLFQLSGWIDSYLDTSNWTPPTSATPQGGGGGMNIEIFTLTADAHKSLLDAEHNIAQKEILDTIQGRMADLRAPLDRGDIRAPKFDPTPAEINYALSVLRSICEEILNPTVPPPDEVTA